MRIIHNMKDEVDMRDENQPIKHLQINFLRHMFYTNVDILNKMALNLDEDTTNT